MAWLPKKKVVVPVDLSPGSVDTLATALELAGSAGQVRAIHVLVPLDAISPGVMFGTVTDRDREKQVRQAFAELAAKHNLPGIDLTVRPGDPGLEITDFARHENADLIVIPSHGYHGMKRVVLGSVAERVIRHAACAVLVLRRPDAE